MTKVLKLSNHTKYKFILKSIEKERALYITVTHEGELDFKKNEHKDELSLS